MNSYCEKKIYSFQCLFSHHPCRYSMKNFYKQRSTLLVHGSLFLIETWLCCQSNPFLWEGFAVLWLIPVLISNCNILTNSHQREGFSFILQNYQCSLVCSTILQKEIYAHNSHWAAVILPWINDTSIILTNISTERKISYKGICKLLFIH